MNTVKEYGPSFVSTLLTGNPSSLIGKIIKNVSNKQQENPGKVKPLNYSNTFNFIKNLENPRNKGIENGIARNYNKDTAGYGTDFTYGPHRHLKSKILAGKWTEKEARDQAVSDMRTHDTVLMDNMKDYTTRPDTISEGPRLLMAQARYHYGNLKKSFPEWGKAVAEGDANKQKEMALNLAKGYDDRYNKIKEFNIYKDGGVIKYQNPAQGIQKRDNTYTQPPIDRTPIIRTNESGKPWNELSTIERASLNVRQGRNPITSKLIARGNLEIASPEFDIIAGIRGVTSLFGSKPKPMILNRTSKLTNAERKGMPKGERNSHSPYNEIGTAKAGDSDFRKITVNSSAFGDFINNGSQQAVFHSVNDPNKVLKVLVDRKFTSVPEIKEFHKQWMKRNQVPIQEKIRFEGYLQGDNRIYPVYSQNKVDVLGDILPYEWTEVHLPKINKEMHKLGYTGEGTFTNGKITVGEVNPYNVGYKDGSIRFIDADVYKKGGKLLLGKRT